MRPRGCRFPPQPTRSTLPRDDPWCFQIWKDISQFCQIVSNSGSAYVFVRKARNASNEADTAVMRLPARTGERRATSALPAATRFAFRLAGLPVSSSAFAVRLWIAITIALCTSFWLQLEAPSSAALTVLILVEPTRGQALAKAGWRLIATIIGVAA